VVLATVDKEMLGEAMTLAWQHSNRPKSRPAKKRG
jgi:hypothetical protein